MLSKEHPVQKRNPSYSWGFCCRRDQNKAREWRRMNLGITEQHGIIPAPSHPLQSAS